MDPTGTVARDTWGSKLAFILAAAGSAIGLGNIWGFPTVAAANGGGAFLLVYLICVVLIGAPVMLAELTIGRAAQRNPVGAFKALAPGTAWKYLGGLGVATGVIILSFYAVIAGWTVSYIFKTIAGTFKPGTDTAAIFSGMAGNPLSAIGFHLLFMGITIYVVVGGVRDGIERWTKVLMPVLFALLILLMIRAVTLSGGGAGLSFYLKPDFSQISGGVILAAAGQAFFSLSLGMGAMITYGSYISKKDDLVSSALWVTGFDTMIAVLAGLIIFPTLFHAGLTPGEGGPGMIFVVLTSLLSEIPPAPLGGIIFGTGFFVLLAVAALTSSVSLLEVGVAWMVDEKQTSRKRAAIMLGAAAFLLGIPSALGNGAVGWLTDLPGLGTDFLTLLFTVFGQYSLTVGALFISIFVAWYWGTRRAAAEVETETGRFPLKQVWFVLIRYVCPIALVAILINLLSSLF
jgi:NSS family neurotransmitter:Na+ symporter